MKKNEKYDSIADLLFIEVISQLGTHHLYIMLNMMVEEMNPIVKNLYDHGIDRSHIGIAEVPIYSGCHKTKCFTPYILKREKKYTDFKQSPVITVDILNFLANKFGNEK